MGVLLWYIKAIGNCTALELWRFISQTGTDLAVSETEILFYIFNCVVLVDGEVV